MATLETLLVQIDASTELLRQELRKGGVAVDQFSRTTNRQVVGVADTFRKVGAQIRNVLGVFGVGFAVSSVTNFVRGAVQAADAIGETARAAGFGAERFQRLSFVFRQNGVEAGEFDSAMRAANTRLGQFITTGAGPAAKAIEQLGLKQRIANGEIRTNEQFVDAIIKALGNVKSSAERAALASAFFGREAGAKLASALALGEEAINSAADAATGIFNDDTVRKADELADAWERISAAAGNWAKSVAIGATHDIGQAIGIAELQPETDAERIADLERRSRMRTAGVGLLGPLAPLALPAAGSGFLTPSEQRELADLRRAQEARSKFRTGGGFGGETGRADGGELQSTEGLEEVTLPSFVRRDRPIALPDRLRKDFDFAAASASVLNDELQEVKVVIAKMPDDLKKFSPEFNKAVSALQNYNDKLSDTARQQDELFRTLGSAMHSSLANAFRGINTNFKDLLKDMAADLAASGLMKALFSVLGGQSAVDAGGVKGLFAGLFGGARALGGPVQRGKGYLVNEGKPELFWPGVSGSMVPVAQGGTGRGTVVIEQNFHVQAGLPPQWEAQLVGVSQVAASAAYDATMSRLGGRR